MDDIRTVVSMLIETKHPKQIILFGSKSREEQTRDSDLDLMVIRDTLDHQGMELVRYPPMFDILLTDITEESAHTIIEDTGGLLTWIHELKL